MLSIEVQHITRCRISISSRRADLLTRQCLLDAMDELLDKKIIPINTPPGYGTPLLIDLADDLALPFAGIRWTPRPEPAALSGMSQSGIIARHVQ